MPREGAENLISAVAKAMGKKKLNVDNFKDRLLMQKGCFILNEKGVCPRYNFGMYIRGPYSRELADDYYELLEKGISYETDVKSELIDEVSDLMSKGAPFVEAYATLLLALKHNPKMKEKAELMEFVINIKPHLEEKIKEAAELITIPKYAI